MKKQDLTAEQTEVWDKIAPEWHEYKTRSSDLAKEFLKSQKGKILDLGSGSGRHLMRIKNGEMYLSDFSKEMIKLAKDKAKKSRIKAQFSVEPMAKLPYEDNFFDAAISISAIHCTPKKDHKKITKELFRVMKPKAKVLIGVWNKESKRFKKYKEKERYIGWQDKGKRYYYLFTEQEIHKLFKDVGFKIIRTQNSELMIRFIAQKP